MKRTLALVLTVLMLLCLVPAMAEGTEGKVNMFGWEIPDETIKFTAYMGNDNPDTVAKYAAQMHDYLVDNFNVTSRYWSMTTTLPSAWV